MTQAETVSCRLTLVRTDLDPSKREGNDFGSGLTYLVQIGILFLPLIMVRPSGMSLVVWLIGLLPVAFAVGHYLRSIRLDELAQKDRIGFATFSADHIRLEHEGTEKVLALDPRAEISVTTRCFQGKPTWSKNRPTHSGIASFKVPSGNVALPFQVLIRSKAEERQFVEVVRSWYLAGYAVRESVYAGSSFLLRTDLTYAEIQRLKNEYGLSKMWPVSKADPHSA